MSLVMRGGRPYTMRITVSDKGGHWSLPANSSELIFRPQAGTARVYWSEQDFFNDPDGNLSSAACVVLNGDQYSGEFRVRAAVGDIWLRGGGAEIELTIVSQTT